MNSYNEIPRILTALCEWGACAVLIGILGRKQDRRRTCLVLGTGLVLLSAFLVLTDDVPLFLWLPCMGAAVCGMHLIIGLCCDINRAVRLYATAIAFLTAEASASAAWMLFVILRGSVAGFSLGEAAAWCVCAALLGLFWQAAWRFEKAVLTEEYIAQAKAREVSAAWLIVLTVFAASNLSFLTRDFPGGDALYSTIFVYRTLVDGLGIAVLCAYQSRISELLAQREATAIRALLRRQYDQYRYYAYSQEMLHIRYHDLKHQLVGLRTAMDEETRRNWIEQLDADLEAVRPLHETGNPVLDTILAAKLFQAGKIGARLTCVADGSLLNGLHVADLCSLFGNALDNALECVALIPNPEKRLIHVQTSAMRGFVLIRIANYCENLPELGEKGLPRTTKPDREGHGYGLKSIRSIAEKYGGTMTVEAKDSWFTLSVLLPMHEGAVPAEKEEYDGMT